MALFLKKICAVVTAVCFTMMIVSPSVFANVPKNSQNIVDAIQAQNNNIQETIVSDKYGKVISYNNSGSDTVVINIQDLHCDYSVQKNIYNIIDELCEKYNISNVYVEGGIGTPDFGVFSHLNPSYKKTVLENLLKSGTLTGAEYYAILNDKKDFLKGVEDEKSYNQNIARLS
ncbi:MAG: hypothetical protein II816_02485, partial [Elusimicrobia bacterium]|nr:hypothetical protein [Elusimicrobiota bacterium]